MCIGESGSLVPPDIFMKTASDKKHTNYNKEMIAGKILPAIISFVLLVFGDQLTKYIVIRHMALYEAIPVIPDIFEIHYIQNTGAAFGMLKNHQLFFIISTIPVILFVVYVYIKCIPIKQFKSLRYLLILILAGATGNLIDRIRLSYVIDFLYFKLIDFPVFNVADCYVTIGFFLMIILVFFKYTDEDFELLIK